MLYQQKVFTLPASEKEISQERWEIAMGQRCPDCKKKTEKCRCGEPKKPEHDDWPPA